MAVLTLEELTQLISDKFGETPDDDAISIIENVTDTFNDLSGKVNTEWLNEKAKLEQAVIDKDNEWRKKYTERFLTGNSSHDSENEYDYENDDKSKESEITIDDLFK